jgi:predicted TIM-barrel fold metal-dependent hydrolase
VFSAVGTPTYFVEHHTGYSLPFQAQIVSLLYSGVFQRYPDLQFVFQEGGVSWLPSLLWRMDRSWRLLGEHEPTLTERPSLAIRKHVSFTTQPMDETEKPEQLLQLLDHLDMDDRLIFATDYPHWDFDDPARILPASRVGVERRRKIAHANAERIFPFPA